MVVVSNGIQSIGDVLCKTFVFSGRARRSDFWYYYIAIVLITGLSAPLVAQIMPQQADKHVSELVSLIAVVPLFALLVRRCHDIRLSGWWALILPPFVVASKASVFVTDGLQWTPPWYVELVRVVLIYALFALILAPGTKGDNRYGPNPRLVREPVAT